MDQKIFHRLLSLFEYKKEYQLKSSGLNYQELHVLERIFKEKESKTLDISKQMAISPSTLIGILDHLERDGLIRRERQQQDKRVVMVTSTEKGKEKVEMHIREDKLFLNNLLSFFSEDEKEQLMALLAKLTSSIEDPEKLFK